MPPVPACVGLLRGDAPGHSAPAYVRRGELGADTAGIVVIDLLEDPQGLRPGPAGGTGVTGAQMHITETGEGAGLEVAVTECAVQAESTLEADRGLLGGWAEALWWA